MIFGFIIGALFLLMVYGIVYLSGSLKVSKELLTKERTANTHLVRRVVDCETVTRNVLQREQEYLKKPLHFTINQEDLRWLAGQLCEHIDAVLCNESLNNGKPN